MPANSLRRLACRLVDDGPLTVLAVIAAAGSFTHIRDLAARAGQHGWMSWAIAVCIDLTCVMAARERHRDQHTGRRRRGLISWPALVLTGGVTLSLAANLAEARPTVWGYITAGVPAAAFLCAVSMLERRSNQPIRDPAADPAVDTGTEYAPEGAESPVTGPVVPASPVVPGSTQPPEPVSVGAPEAAPDVAPVAPGLRSLAQRIAAEHREQHGHPISADQLRRRLRVPAELATRLHAEVQTA